MTPCPVTSGVLLSYRSTVKLPLSYKTQILHLHFPLTANPYYNARSLLLFLAIRDSAFIVVLYIYMGHFTPNRPGWNHHYFFFHSSML